MLKQLPNQLTQNNFFSLILLYNASPHYGFRPGVGDGGKGNRQREGTNQIIDDTNQPMSYTLL